MIGNLVRRREQTNNKAMEQSKPRRRRTSARLAFADHVDYLVAGQRSPGSPKRTKKPWLALTRRGNRPVVLLQDNIEVRHRQPESSVPADPRLEASTFHWEEGLTARGV